MRDSKPGDAQVVTEIPVELGGAMMIPSLLPDELLQGYLGRIRWLNVTDEIEPIMRAALPTGDQAGDSRHLLELVAQANGLSLSLLVSSHTHWAIRFAKPPLALDDQIKLGLSARKEDRFHPLRQSRKGAWLCAECVREDIGFWGLSYWRRTHHIPGAHWCLKHEAPLSAVNDRGAFNRPPHHWRQTAVEDATRARRYADNIVITRYVEAFDLVTEKPGYLDRAAVCRSLRALAGGRDYAPWRTIADSRLAAMADSAVPPEWLSDALSGGFGAPDALNSFYLSRGAGGLPISAIALVLAAALLCNSAEEAATVLLPFVACQAKEDPKRSLSTWPQKLEPQA